MFPLMLTVLNRDSNRVLFLHNRGRNIIPIKDC